jgi:hypothetical protein
MMEDWTDIIGEELENIEAPLPADDWSVLQQKYAAAQRKKRAAAFAWAGGITSVAAAVALVLLLVRPDSSSVIPGSTGDLNDLVAEILPPIEEVVPVDSSHVEYPIDTVLYVAPTVQKKVSVPVDVVKKPVDDVLIAENNTEEITTENTEEVFDVIRDTTSLKDKLLADASIANKKDSSDDAYTEPTGTFGFDDFPEDEPRRKRRPMSIGMSGSVSGSPIIKMMDVANPEVPPDFEMPKDTTDVETPAPAAVMMRNSRKYNESYRHEIPISFGVSVRYNLTDKLSVNTGLNYTRYTSTRERYYYTGGADMDKQYAHYLGIPVRLDWLAVNKKHFNFYIGAGVQADKCIYATVGNERLREKEVLFGLNGALGFQVNIVPMVGLYFEPEISYALNEGSIETFRYNEPLMISARAGLRFNF